MWPLLHPYYCSLVSLVTNIQYFAARIDDHTLLLATVVTSSSISVSDAVSVRSYERAHGHCGPLITLGTRGPWLASPVGGLASRCHLGVAVSFRCVIRFARTGLPFWSTASADRPNAGCDLELGWLVRTERGSRSGAVRMSRRKEGKKRQPGGDSNGRTSTEQRRREGKDESDVIGPERS